MIWYKITNYNDSFVIKKVDVIRETDKFVILKSSLNKNGERKELKENSPYLHNHYFKSFEEVKAWIVEILEEEIFGLKLKIKNKEKLLKNKVKKLKEKDIKNDDIGLMLNE